VAGSKSLRMCSAWLVLGLLAILDAACMRGPEVVGPEHLVIALGDTTELRTVEPLLRGALEKSIFTPHEELIYKVRLLPAESLATYLHYRHLLFVGTLDASGKAGEYISKLVGRARPRVEADSAFVFSKPDAWVKDQLLVVFTAKDMETLRRHLSENGEVLFRLFDDFDNGQVRRRMYATLEQKKLHQHLLERYGWTLRVQHDYFVALEEPGFVFLRRVDPERWLFVAWEETNDPSRLTKDWVLEKRAWVGRTYYGGDTILDLDLQVREVNFNGRYALQFDGIWENAEKIAGGPWRAYAFYDQPTGRLYLIDLAVFAPMRERKMPFLRQLDVMAHTFRTQYERAQD